MNIVKTKHGVFHIQKSTSGIVLNHSGSVSRSQYFSCYNNCYFAIDNAKYFLFTMLEKKNQIFTFNLFRPDTIFMLLVFYDRLLYNLIVDGAKLLLNILGCFCKWNAVNHIADKIIVILQENMLIYSIIQLQQYSSAKLFDIFNINQLICGYLYVSEVFTSFAADIQCIYCFDEFCLSLVIICAACLIYMYSCSKLYNQDSNGS